MRKLALIVSVLLASTSARAADYPVVPEVMPFNWTGLYVGLAGGGGFVESDFHVKDEECHYLNGLCGISHNPDGIVVGGQVGGMWQFANTPFVVGVEGQGLFANFRDNQDVIFGLVKTESRTQELFMGKGQIGYAFDRALIYGTGGWAGADREVSATIPILGAKWSDNQFLDGFVYGAGAKFVVVDGSQSQSPSVIFGVEWNRIELNGDFSNEVKFNEQYAGGWSKELRGCCSAPRLKVGSDDTIDVITGNVSIKF